MAFDRSSRRRLNSHTARLFTDDTLFGRVARAVCAAECLPRKELFEAWEVARRVRRRFRGRPIVELCAGHGLLAHLLLILDDSSPHATCVDRVRPPSAARLARVLEETWPRLVGRVRYVEDSLEQHPIEPNSLVVSVHACGALTDRVIDRALASHAQLAVVPCCHALGRSDDGGLSGWLPGPVAVDVTRAQRLRAEGYQVRTQTLPEDITPQNRLLMAEPRR
jgi:hypothetical protein